MNRPVLPSALHALIILVVSTLSTVAAAQTSVVTYSDPAGRFTLIHPATWESSSHGGQLELYGDGVSLNMHFFVHPIEALPEDLAKDDPETLAEVMLEGMLADYRDVERVGPETTTLADRAMIRIQFRGVSTRPVTLPRQGALYVAISDTHFVSASYSAPESAHEELLPKIKAVLESFTLTD